MGDNFLKALQTR